MPNKSPYPPKPNFPALNSTADRQRIFGKFAFRAKPVKGNPENIVILGDWREKNVVRVVVPQLVGVDFAPKDGAIYFHKYGVNQLLAMFEAWERAGLMHLVKTWAGSYVPRFIRGSKSVLSNHAFATAFDINVPWNPLGKKPAPRGAEGSVVELVEIANRFGFYWGGHFDRRPDGMHFELAKLIGPAALRNLLADPAPAGSAATAATPPAAPAPSSPAKGAEPEKAPAQNSPSEEEPSLTDSLLDAVPSETITSTAGKLAGKAAAARKGWAIFRPLGIAWAALEAGNVWAWAGLIVLAAGLVWLAYSHRAGIKRLGLKLLGRAKSK